MCGRFVQDLTYQEVKERFQAQNELPGIRTRYNITPGMFVPVITKQSPNQAVLMKWGLIPHWAKDPNIGYKMINARAETLMTKPSFKYPFVKNRCLVPTTGFYEWQKLDSGKIPYFIHLKSEKIFAMAGIFDRWMDAEKHEVLSFSIITCEPNQIIAPIHNRMPAILSRINENQWLNSGSNPMELLNLLKPFNNTETEAYQISSQVNSPQNDSPDLIKSVVNPTQQTLIY